MGDLDRRIDSILPDVVEWRHDLHAHPELAFEEKRTAAFIAERLTSFGLEVHTGRAGTGVVGVLRCGNGPSIGMRADIDALPIEEAIGLPYASRHSGRMHACGHDGHTAMLLGAARVLAEARPKEGTFVFIFQPAEENEGGARVMVEQGLFSRFPVDAVYGAHNWPGLPCGHLAVHAGPVMAAFDTFEATIEGKGSHGAMPHQGVDPITIAAQLQIAWQTIVSRSVSPTDAAVISVTQIHAGDTWNVIPDKLVLRGTVRSFDPQVRDLLEAKMAQRADKICAALDASCRFVYQRRYPATINSVAEAGTARRAAALAVGGDRVVTDRPPSMGAEDFAFMLEQKPGAYIWIGNGPDAGGRNLHSPHYDFNDTALPHGIRYWVRLAETICIGAAT
ncbi:M20 aminoacylase family protein [Bradyrhizobium sp. AS23.2]|uniref:M20 aminoacylase family protein n=1 Tax=Bradyrhizobium sp. AS23.2 TaxID=1680155 RepID=UPI0009400891|nr:M20 aminoacylase family protein [Bradyrhizobium sp. AS23.2]OKO87437.1 peptidase M20 [Bradyrhizobium sp. AS23.2]